MLSGAGIVVSFVPLLHGSISAAVRREPIWTRRADMEWKRTIRFTFSCMAFLLLSLVGLLVTSTFIQFNEPRLTFAIECCSPAAFMLWQPRIHQFSQRLVSQPKVA